MDLSRAPLIAVIIVIEIILDLAILLAVSAATAGLSYSPGLLIVTAVLIIAFEAWLDRKYLI